jgi:hypothetical protein
MRYFKYTSQVFLCLALALAIPTGHAADIDIYARPPSSSTSSALNPNILIVIDNSANWASASQHWAGGIKQGEAELDSLRTVIGQLDATTNVGLMMFTPGGIPGGYIRFAMRPMNAINKAALTELIGFPSGCVNGPNSLNGTPDCILANFNGGEKVASAKTDYSAAMLDVFKYFGGYTWPLHAQDGVAGLNVNSTQFGTLRYAGNFPPGSYFDLAAFTDAAETNYNSPLAALNNCAKNYVIFIGNGFPSQDSPSTLLGPPSNLPTQGVGGDVTQLPLPNLVSTTSTVTNTLATTSCGTYPGVDATSSTAACNAKASQPVTISTTNPAAFTEASHGLAIGEGIQFFTTGSLPTGLALNTTYYVIAAGYTSGGFEVSTSAGGAAVATSGTQSGTQTFSSLAVTYPGYSSYSCQYASTCSSGSTTTSTTNLGTSACGSYATSSACVTGTKAAFPGYNSYSCTPDAGTACVASASNTLHPILNPSSCIGNNTINKNTNTASTCNTYFSTTSPWSTEYSGFTCSTPANCSGGNTWVVDATTALTNGLSFTMSGTNSSTVNSTSYSQTITGSYNVTAATPDGTYSAPTKINNFDEWTRYLHQTDLSAALGQQNISTYTIDVFKDQQDLNETALLISAAQAGGGKYFQATNSTAITNALKNIFSEIQSVNSVFASSSLPVSVNTQGTYLNQVFMGMFRPEGDASPRWPGNLKQYQFALINGVLKLADKNGLDAISPTTGFVTPCAISFWSTDTGQYWNYGAAQAIGDCTSATSAFPTLGSTSAYSDAPDGEVVEKGGAAQRLRGVYSSGGVLTSSSQNYQVCATGTIPSATGQCRAIYTCDNSTPGSCTALTSFDATNAAITSSTLNLPPPISPQTVAQQVASLINWTRGQDVDNENANLDASNVPITNEMRPSAHGGVVHAQPAVVDYGSPIGTVAFYGDDQGVLHAVDGNQADTDGYEMWGFIAPETEGKLNRLRTNSPLISFPGVLGSPPPIPKDYFFDGAIGVYQNAAAGKVWIFPSMRRGGRAIYAFDVSDPTHPVLKWRKGCFTNDTTNDTVCASDTIYPAAWAGIGQTWSQPIPSFISGYVDSAGKPKPVLIFGGGYDQCEDVDSQTRCTTTPRKGANVWIVDADTGAILRVYPTLYSVPGDVATLKDTNGNLTSIYASDTGGDVYRINVGTLDTTGTTFTGWSSNAAAGNIQIASLSDPYQARKFLNGPSVIPSGKYNVVELGSGDREHPLVSDYGCGNYSVIQGSYVTNQFYMLMDTPTGYPSPAWGTGDLANVTSGTTTASTSTAGVTTITNVSATGVTTSSTKGWRFDFGQCEQSVNKALTIAGVTYFGTNAPGPTTTGSCAANLGIARGYAVDYLTGNASYANRYGVYVGGGMPPSPVAGVVSVGGTKYPFCIGCINPDAANSSALQGTKVVINPKGSRYRAYWYRESD